MKICPVCQAQLADEAAVCPRCGTVCGAAQQPQPQPQPQPQQPQQPGYQPPYQAPYQPPVTPYVDPFDHTAEFSAEDIHENKVYAMLPYLMSLLGVLVALIGAKDSAYVQFHVKQALRIHVLSILLAVVIALLFWTIIVAIAGAVCLVILEVLAIIGFFQVCGNKAKELSILRGMNFLK